MQTGFPATAPLICNSCFPPMKRDRAASALLLNFEDVVDYLDWEVGVHGNIFQ